MRSLKLSDFDIFALQKAPGAPTQSERWTRLGKKKSVVQAEV